MSGRTRLGRPLPWVIVSCFFIETAPGVTPQLFLLHVATLGQGERCLRLHSHIKGTPSTKVFPLNAVRLTPSHLNPPRPSHYPFQSEVPTFAPHVICQST
ncbi:hypothetical protein CEXT_118921 [Caerostris extrusa]|uniref:Secreted protein n=1 Tax=Caerostris extrusa TaxID=172846 RepID=A0AAV4XZZ9_CAEEX|nr:hypothetical protein CEXT_118921 [Caerostris extrusa]